MKKTLAMVAIAMLALGTPYSAPQGWNTGFTANAQTGNVTGVITDAKGEPLIGASVLVKGTNKGTSTDVNGRYSIQAAAGNSLIVAYVGMKTKEVKVAGTGALDITLASDATALDEVVVTALGIKKDKKSLGYAIDEINSDELMRNKSTNAINSLSGKVAGVSITQTGGAAGAGSQIILRGGTSLERDNQPLFVVDGVIFDNSTSCVGNSAYDGMTNNATTNSNRVMDINPEDIESMSILKGPAASALYGSRAASGVVIITTKKGKEGTVEVNFSTKYQTSWVTRTPKMQDRYGRGKISGFDSTGAINYDMNTTSSWGKEIGAGDQAYDNIGDFFQNAGTWDTNLSVAGGNKTGNFFLSGSFYGQDGVVPTTDFTKTTFRFNGEQRWKMLTFTANAAYAQSRTTKTLTSAGLYGSGGSGSMAALYQWPRNEEMRHYLNEDGTPYRILDGYQDRSQDIENPYWMLDNYSMKDNTERFNGSFSVKADITPWWWVSFRMGIDSYTTENNNHIAANAAVKATWQNGMLSHNSQRYQYLSTNLMTNFNKQFGDFNFNLMLGMSTDDTKNYLYYHYGQNLIIPGFYSFGNIDDKEKHFVESKSRHRLVGVFGEFRADWRNTAFVTVTGRNDWSSTLPLDNRSYFYPSVSGSFAFSQLLQDLDIIGKDVLTFGKIRASWARVGKDASPYATLTYLENPNTELGGLTGYGNGWTRGNSILKPETTVSTEIGLELRFFNNRLKFDYAYYTNNTKDQIISPRGPQSTGYIFCAQNTGDVYNKGMELTIGGTPVQEKDWTWETSINLYGNRGTVKNLPDGTDYIYLTDVQLGNTQAASYNNSTFMGIAGKTYKYDEQGRVLLNQDGMPTNNGGTYTYVGNREPKLQGGWNNTVSYKGFTFNMLWEFRIGGYLWNGTDYALISAGTSNLTANRDEITIPGIMPDGTLNPTFKANETYTLNGATVSGKQFIQEYYSNYYLAESRNFMTKVNSLRLRTISLSYDLPKSILAKTRVIKRAALTATANNLVLATNYHGDPEAAAAGSGVTGSSSVGVDYCGVPSCASFAFGINLSF